MFQKAVQISATVRNEKPQVSAHKAILSAYIHRAGNSYKELICFFVDAV